MALINRGYSQMGPTQIARSDSLLGYTEHGSLMMEKRRLFLRSYQFSRKQSLTEKLKRSLGRVKKVIWLRLRSVRKIRRLVWSRLRFALYYRRKRRFLHLLSPNNHRYVSSNSSCFW